MLQPKRTKFRKQFKGTGKLRGMATRGSTVAFGDFGMKSAERGMLTSRQIEAARRVLAREFRKYGKQIWIRVFPDKPITRKPLEVRMGSGKGSVEYWVAVIQPGRILFEVEGIPIEVARKAFRLAGNKLPVKVVLDERTVM